MRRTRAVMYVGMYSFSKSQLATMFSENKVGVCVILPELTSGK